MLLKAGWVMHTGAVPEASAVACPPLFDDDVLETFAVFADLALAATCAVAASKCSRSQVK